MILACGGDRLVVINVLRVCEVVSAGVYFIAIVWWCEINICSYVAARHGVTADLVAVIIGAMIKCR